MRQHKVQALKSGVTWHSNPVLTSRWTHYLLFSGRLLQSVPSSPWRPPHDFKVVRDKSPTRSLPHESLRDPVWPRKTLSGLEAGPCGAPIMPVGMDGFAVPHIGAWFLQQKPKTS